MKEVCLIVPNRRAVLFFKKHFARLASKTTWLPDIFSIEDFIVRISGLSLIDNMTLLIEMYEAYVSIAKDKADDLETFLGRAPMIVSDFNETDLYLVDAGQLFTYLKEAKNITAWNPATGRLTESQNKYIDFYSSLYPLYSALSEKLLGENRAYQGLIYRTVAENMDTTIKKLRWSRVVFAGFNALTASEEKIIGMLHDAGKADILWDADNYYTGDTSQEAGKFIRKYKTFFRDVRGFGDFENCFLENEKDIEIIAVPKNIGQVKIAGQLLESIPELLEHPEKTAVVLADESLLMPLIISLPGNISDFNVTMGYPLKYTSAYNLADGYFNLHLNAERFSKLKSAAKESGTSSTGGVFYFRDILKICNNPLLSFALTNGGNSLLQLKDILAKSNRIFYRKDQVIELVESEKVKALLSLFLNDIPLEGDPLFTLGKILELFIADNTMKQPENDSQFEIYHILELRKILQKLSGLCHLYPDISRKKIIYKLFRQIADGATIPFTGEPLKGIQIMGLLETRLLDFENIILLSLNDEIVPSGRKINSFIPLDIKKIFGLPVYSDRDAIFAYHFYRLLQRSRRVFLLYNSEPGNFGSGDKSRFINQIVNELPAYNPKIKITEQVLAPYVTINRKENSIEIPKTSGVISSLKELAGKKFSPSSLNLFRTCPLKYYFAKIAHLEEPDELSETIDAATLGEIIHETLSDLYRPYLNKILRVENINSMQVLADDLVDEKTAMNYKDGDVDSGKNLLVSRIAKLYVRRLLLSDKDAMTELEGKGQSLEVLFLEHEFSTQLAFKNNLSVEQIELYGRIDRIDRFGDMYRLIDYKTGIVKQADLKIKDWGAFQTDVKYNIPFQLLIYSCLFDQKFRNDKLKAGVISFRNLSQGFAPVQLFDEEFLTTDCLNEFRSILTQILEDIFDESKPFIQTTKVENCNFCPYKVICNR